MEIKLFVDERKLESAGHPFMRVTRSVEVWRNGHKIGTLKNDGNSIFIEYNNRRKREIIVR